MIVSSGEHFFGEPVPECCLGVSSAKLYWKEKGVYASYTRLHPIRERDELLPLDTYIHQLPINYEPERDKINKKNRLLFSSDLENLIPFYGRSRGTGHPGFVFYNRGGEPLTFDPLNKLDRTKNAFGLVLGPPGSGKSALMVYILMQVVAIYGKRSASFHSL